MCVGVPAKVVEKMEYSAIVDVMGSQTTVGIIFVPEVAIGDFVIVHAGQAMSNVLFDPGTLIISPNVQMIRFSPSARAIIASIER